MTGCGTVRRTVTHEVSSFKVQDTRSDTVREQVMMAVHDTVMETKTITYVVNQKDPSTGSGQAKRDTVFTSVVTDRERIRDRAAIKDKKEKVIVRTDTVYVECRDSVMVSSSRIDSTRSSTFGSGSGSKPASPFVRSLRWIVALVIAVIVLIMVIKTKW